jgi:unsaturated chondroitin disaccharide hydrolase
VGLRTGRLDALVRLVRRFPGWEGILKRGIYHLPKDVGVDESLAWGDYYFLEALSKAVG